MDCPLSNEDIQNVHPLGLHTLQYSPYRKKSPTSSNGLSAGDEDIQDVHTPGLLKLQSLGLLSTTPDVPPAAQHYRRP